jgi:hypothetical protein
MQFILDWIEEHMLELKNVSNKLFIFTVILQAIQILVDGITFLILWRIDSKQHYIDFYFNLWEIFN